MKIDGKEIAKEAFESLKREVSELKKKGIVPSLAIILIGNDPASENYVNQKQQKAFEIGAHATVHHLDSSTTLRQLTPLIKMLNNNKNVHGIIVQRPVPHIKSESIDSITSSEKDIDAFRNDSPYNPPIAEAILKILEYVCSEENNGKINEQRLIKWLQKKSILVIGKGETGGKPIVSVLQKLGLVPLMADSKTQNLIDLTKKADIIISAVGKSNIITKEMIKEGVILISVGLHKEDDGKLYGDYNEEEIKNVASYYSPTPGGVGPVNVAALLLNLVSAAKK